MALLDKVERLLRGAVIEDVQRRDHSWQFYLSIGELEITQAWRLAEKGKLLVTDGEDGFTFGEAHAIDAEEIARTAVAGRRILGALIDPETADLRISVDGDVRLDALTTNSRAEAWHLSVGDDVFAASGGRVSDPAWFFKGSSEA